jgi:hypothetical protein
MFLPDNFGDREIHNILRQYATHPEIVTAKHVHAFKAVHYAINRAKRYPSPQDQLDMMFHKTWDRYIMEIKEGWRKPTIREIRCLQDLQFNDPRELFQGTDVLDLMTVLCYGKFSNRSPSVVIGSSPSLLGKGLGKDIDKYKHVIRVNWYPTTKKFQDDIGTREDVVVIKTSGGAGRESKLKLNLGRDSANKCKMHPAKIWVANMLAGSKINAGTLEYMQNCYNTNNFEGRGSQYKGFARKHNLGGAFTGTQAIVLAHLETGKSVDIVGFCSTSYDTYRHYYDAASVSYQINHHSSAEDNAIIKLLELGVISRVLDIC